MQPQIRRSGTASILLTKTTAAQTEDALSYYRVRGLYFLVVFFVATIIAIDNLKYQKSVLQLRSHMQAISISPYNVLNESNMI